MYKTPSNKPQSLAIPWPSRITSKNAKFPYYSELSARIKSFANSIFRNPEIFAKAGFFYIGRGDRVKCFHCGGGLNEWLPSDTPIQEHIRWYSNCYFVRRMLRFLTPSDFIKIYREECGYGGCWRYPHYRSTHCTN